MSQDSQLFNNTHNLSEFSGIGRRYHSISKMGDLKEKMDFVSTRQRVCSNRITQKMVARSIKRLMEGQPMMEPKQHSSTLKSAAQSGDGSKTENQENIETVDVESAPTIEQDVSQRVAAFDAEMAAREANPLLCFPKPIRRNVRALRKLRLEHKLLEEDFIKELHELEMKYEKKCNPLYEKRTAIVTGAHVPTEDECHYESDDEKEIESADAVEDAESGEKEDGNQPGIPKFWLTALENANGKGIPEFWLQVLSNAPPISEMIEDHDEPILKHLVDIKAETSKDPMGFLLEFHFEPNEYFTDTVLTKFYELRCLPEYPDIFAFKGPEIVKSKGCPIAWKKNKNVTVKTIKEKHEARGAVRTITKTFKTNSFFNFFSPPAVPENEDVLDMRVQHILDHDFEVGNLIKDEIIPRADVFFTGESHDYYDFQSDSEDDESDEEDHEEEEEDHEEEDDDEMKMITSA